MDDNNIGMYRVYSGAKRCGFWAEDWEGGQIRSIRRLTNFLCWLSQETRIDGMRYVKLQGQLGPEVELPAFWMSYSRFRTGSGFRGQILEHWGVQPIIMCGVRIFEIIDVILDYSRLRLQQELTQEVSGADTLPWLPIDFEFSKQ